jgi:hypothetical protein
VSHTTPAIGEATGPDARTSASVADVPA